LRRLAAAQIAGRGGGDRLVGLLFGLVVLLFGRLRLRLLVVFLVGSLGSLVDQVHPDRLLGRGAVLAPLEVDGRRLVFVMDAGEVLLARVDDRDLAGGALGLALPG